MEFEEFARRGLAAQRAVDALTTPEKPSQEASEAWQDVNRRLLLNRLGDDEPAYLADDVEQARAADAQQIAALRAENEQWTTWGVIEIAVRNVNVASYMNEWEGRALKAEAQLTALQAEQAQWQQEIGRIENDIRRELVLWPTSQTGMHVRNILTGIAAQLAALTAQQEKG